MRKEDKDLLIKDLCSRLPYGVKCNALLKQIDGSLKSVFGAFKGYDGWAKVGNNLVDIETVRPYLRPLSSMTDEEKEEMHNTLSPEGTAVYENNGISIPMNHYGDFVGYKFMSGIIQYLLEHHFDFMDLIPKGLAIEVTKENNPYKE